MNQFLLVPTPAQGRVTAAHLAQLGAVSDVQVTRVRVYSVAANFDGSRAQLEAALAAVGSGWLVFRQSECRRYRLQ